MAGKPDPGVAARRARALQLRAQGLTYAQIAADLGHRTASAACQDVTRALAARKGWLDEQAALFVTLEVERLDVALQRIEAVIAAAVAEGDQLMVLRAVDRQVRVSERRGRLLGLDVPSQLIVRDAPRPAEPARQANGIDEIAKRRAKRRRGAAG